jgi:transposase
MQRLQALKFELRPDGEQQRNMRRFAGSCRFVYNKALAVQKENHEAGNKFIGYVPMAANLPIWKREVGQQWLKDAPSQALQHALKDLENAYKNFFAKRAEFPRFKRKGSATASAIPSRNRSNSIRTLLAVSPHHTSQTCPCCGHVSKDNRQTQAKFLCIACGYEHHADIVGAINVLARGHRVLACGEMVQSGHSVKQELTEAPRRLLRGAVGIPVL